MQNATFQKTALTTPATLKSQKHPFHILDTSPFPFLTGLFLLTLLTPLTFFAVECADALLRTEPHGQLTFAFVTAASGRRFYRASDNQHPRYEQNAAFGLLFIGRALLILQVLLISWWWTQTTFEVTLLPNAGWLVTTVSSDPILLLLLPLVSFILLEFCASSNASALLRSWEAFRAVADHILTALKLLILAGIAYPLAAVSQPLKALWDNIVSWRTKTTEIIDTAVLFRDTFTLKRKLNGEDVMEFIRVHAQKYGRGRQEAAESAQRYLQSNLGDLTAVYQGSLERGQLRVTELLEEFVRLQAVEAARQLKLDQMVELAKNKALTDLQKAFKWGGTEASSESPGYGNVWTIASKLATQSVTFISTHPYICVGAVLFGISAFSVKWSINYMKATYDPVITRHTAELMRLEGLINDGRADAFGENQQVFTKFLNFRAGANIAIDANTANIAALGALVNSESVMVREELAKHLTTHAEAAKRLTSLGNQVDGLNNIAGFVEKSLQDVFASSKRDGARIDQLSALSRAHSNLFGAVVMRPDAKSNLAQTTLGALAHPGSITKKYSAQEFITEHDSSSKSLLNQLASGGLGLDLGNLDVAIGVNPAGGFNFNLSCTGEDIARIMGAIASALKNK